MKRLLQLSLMALLCAIQFEILAQDVENQLPKNTQEWMDEDWPVTDSLAFELPNQGKLLILFNGEEHNPEDLTLKFKPILKKATDFPEFKTITYRLAEAFPQTSLDRVLLNIEKNYVPYVDRLELTFPVGLDYTGGYFTPEIGFRSKISWRRFDIGASITNSVFFPEKIENKVSVNHNWFLNAEFSWELFNPKSNNKNMIGIGYLLNDEKSQLFDQTTVKAFYRRQVSQVISIQVGLVGTNNLNTFYPTIGVRFW